MEIPVSALENLIFYNAWEGCDRNWTYLLLALIVLLVVIGVKILVYVIIPVAAILFIVNLIISLIDNHRM